MMREQRHMLEKRLIRLRPENAAIILPMVDQLIEKLKLFQFSDRSNSRIGMPFLSHELWFERPHSQAAFAYIQIVFSDDGDLSFGMTCGVRGLDEHNTWHSYASLSKSRLGLWRTCNLGASTLSIFKKCSFVKDWRLLMNELTGISRFLETGVPSENLTNIIVYENFQRRDLA